MKNIIKTLIVLIGIFPLILKAESIEEVKDNWYIVEENIHYERDAENICEYFDENNYFYTDYIYSLEEPKHYPYREISIVEEEIKLDRNYHNTLSIINFANDTTKIKIYEIEVLDKDNNIIEYELGHYGNIDGNLNNLNDADLNTYAEAYSYATLDLNYKNTQNIKDLTIKVIYEKNDKYNGLNFYTKLHEEIQTNSFARYETINTLECKDTLCETTQKTKENEFSNQPITFNTKIYKYRDKYTKCYTPKKIVFKKDEQIIEKEDDKKINNEFEKQETSTSSNNKYEPVANNNVPNEIIYKEPIINEISQTENKENTTNDNIKTSNKVAIVTKEKKENSKINFIPIIVIFFVILSLVTFIYKKKVIKCRTK